MNPSPPAPFRPEGALDLETALTPYRGAWGTRKAAHLLRRAGFGGSPKQVEQVAAGSMDAAVDRLITFADTSSLPAQPSDLQDDRPRQRRRAMLSTFGVLGMEGGTPARPDPAALDAMRKVVGQARRHNAVALQTWWLQRMIASPAPLQEKMTLFWHGRFTSAYGQKGISAQDALAQNQLFRANALGNVRSLVLALSRDPAMLKYLDNRLNRKGAPNENYARELMELFTLGIGNYTETDVRESARAFTGYTIARGDTFVFNQALHDDGTKTFLGRTGNFNGDDVVRIIFEQPAAARFLAGKILTFFVYDDPEPELVDAVAALIRKNDFEMRPVMSTILRSQVFHSERAYRALVKSPIEFVVGAAQLYGDTDVSLALLGALRRMGQTPFYPPNVKGWDGGAAWLNSNAMLTRENVASALTQSPSMMQNAVWLVGTEGMDPKAIANRLVDGVLQGDASPASRLKLEQYLGGAGTSALGMLSGENLDERLRGAAYLAMAFPAYQLN